MKKSRILLSLFTVFALILVIVGCSGSVSAAEAYVTIDINPSIELVVNNRDEVVYVNALNEDAEVLLVDLDIIGMNVEDAMDLIIDKAIELGYIDTEADETYVSVSSTSETDFGERVKNRIKAAINNAFLVRSMMGKARDKAFTDEFIAEAESYGVEPGFLSLAYQVTYADDEITLEAALAMTQEDLVDILKEARSAAKDLAQAYKQEFLQARAEIRNQYLPDIQDLEAQIEALETEIANATEDTTELEAQLAQLEANLQAVKDEMGGALLQLREQYQAMTQEMVQAYQEMEEQRQSQFREKVNQWKENRDRGNSDAVRDRIRTFQDTDDSDDSADTVE